MARRKVKNLSMFFKYLFASNETNALTFAKENDISEHTIYAWTSREKIHVDDLVNKILKKFKAKLVVELEDGTQFQIEAERKKHKSSR